MSKFAILVLTVVAGGSEASRDASHGSRRDPLRVERRGEVAGDQRVLRDREAGPMAKDEIAQRKETTRSTSVNPEAEERSTEEIA